MAAYKYPRKVEILADLPKTETGKILRRELRDREWRGTAS
jgi:long-chain acyl-CoA synthetase